MKAVVQRVTRAEVTVDEEVIGKIGHGLVVLLGVAEGDTEKERDLLARKITGLRIFMDDQGKTNLSLEDTGGELLIVSQFTLLADCRKGRRPSFVKAGDPEKAEKMYEEFIEICRQKGLKVAHGSFGAVMQISLVNDGPFTIVLDTDDL